MKLSRLVISLLALCVPRANATTYYVATSGNDGNAGTSWALPKLTIQAAADLAVDGDTVIVSNGTYSGGGRAWGGGSLSNLVVITNNITVRSANGPAVTAIDGKHSGFTPATAVRCVLMTNGTLSGFSLLFGGSLTNGGAFDINGAGVYMTAGFVSNCVISGCNSGNGGGGAAGNAGATLYDCTLSGNTAVFSGGGANGVSLNRCRVSGNTANTYGGGTYYCYVYNSLIAANHAGTNAGGIFGTFNTFNCTIVGNSAASAGGADYVYLRNCIVWSNTATVDHPDIGALNNTLYSCSPTDPGGEGNITNNPLFLNAATGDFHLGCSSPCVNAGNNGNVSETGDADGYNRIVDDTVDMGAFEQQIWYVATNGSDAADGQSWDTAKQTIQAGADMARVGETVLASNGLYAAGRTGTPGYNTSNRVVITRDIVVASLNGPDVTAIVGSKGSNPTNRSDNFRCVFITNGLLTGFTLTNGATPVVLSGSNQEINGAGAYAAGGTISNCLFAGNSAYYAGGGSFDGAIYNSRYVGNSAIYGGGGNTGTFYACTFTSNGATFGGGTMECAMYNSLLRGNTSSYGGGTYFSAGYNCTLAGNTASVQGGGADGGKMYNSILYFNSSPSGSNSINSGFTNSCTAPLAVGPGNTAGDPQFANASAGDYRLKAISPALDHGSNAYVQGAADLAGNARIVNTTVDMGAYEYDQTLATYDSDGDGFTDQEEYYADTDPRNGESFFPNAAVTDAAPGEVSFTIDPSSAGRIYDIYASDDLLGSPQVWTWVSGGQPGNAGALILTVTNDVPGRSYRTGVRLP